MSTGLWPEVAKRFEQDTGYKVQLVSSGPREGLADDFKQGKADLLTMHSGDITTDLVADGYGANMRPWTKNEMVIVGPVSDPAHIKGTHDGAAAMRKIVETKSLFVDFQNIGSREMAHNLWKQAGINPKGEWLLKDESETSEDVLKFAQQHHAYVIVGRIPVLTGKMPSEGMEIMVHGDPLMRRPFIVLEANPKKFPEANVRGARALSNYLLSKRTQEFLLEFGKEHVGTRPLFFPIVD